MPFYYYSFDIRYLLLIVPAMLFALYAQGKVNATFSKYGRVPNANHLTGAQAARQILDHNGLTNIAVEHVNGKLTDHYDPKANVIRLSDSVYQSDSVAAVGVAAHEAGHAVQHALGYTPIRVRNALVPVANIASYASIPLILIGLLFEFVSSLALVGLVLYSATFVFQLATLPVEFNASSRAVQVLSGMQLLNEEEVGKVKKVLSAAALTYVAATVTALVQLLRIVMLVLGNRRND